MINDVELELYLHHKTAMALLVSDDGEEENAVWIAKSLVKYEPIEGNRIQATVPEWLAIKKGLV